MPQHLNGVRGQFCGVSGIPSLHTSQESSLGYQACVADTVGSQAISAGSL